MATGQPGWVTFLVASIREGYAAEVAESTDEYVRLHKGHILFWSKKPSKRRQWDNLLRIQYLDSFEAATAKRPSSDSIKRLEKSLAAIDPTLLDLRKRYSA